MENNSSQNCRNHKRERSWDLNELPKPDPEEEKEGMTDKTLNISPENESKRRKKSLKEVSLSCSEPHVGKSRGTANSEQGLRSQNLSGRTKELHGVSDSLGKGGSSAFNIDKRPRGSVSKPLRLANSARILNDKVIGSADKAGGNNELRKSVAVSASKDGGLNPKCARKVGVPNEKVMEKEDSKSKGGSCAKLKQKVESKSTNRSDWLSRSVRAFKDAVMKHKRNDDAANPKSATKVGVSNSKGKEKAQLISTTGSDPISKSLKHSKSIDPAGALKGVLIKHNDKADTRDKLAKSVAASRSSDGALKSNSSKSKVMQEADPRRKSLLSAEVKQRIDPKLKGVSNAKANQKFETKSIDGSDKALGPLGVPKSIDRVGAFKPKDKAGTTSVGNSGSLKSISTVKVGALVQKVKEKACQSSISSLKTKEKADSRSVSGSNQVSVPMGLPKSVDRSGAFDRSVIKHKGKASASDQVVKSITQPVGNNGSSNSESVGKVGGSMQKVNEKVHTKSKLGLHSSQAKQNAGAKCVVGSNAKLEQKKDANSADKCGRANSKLKRKADGDEINENRNEDDEAVNNGQTSSKKRRIDSKKKGVVIGGDGGKEASKKFVSDSIFADFDEDDDDDEYDNEEKLERNAARMLSSRFDPSCTGFSSKRKSSAPQMVASSHNSSADDTKKRIRPRKEDSVKGAPRKRRHFYEILPQDFEPDWFLNRRIKVFWPLDDKWYDGLVDDYQSESKRHHIKYDDQDEEWIDLEEEKFKLLLFPSEVPGGVKSRKAAEEKRVRKGEAVAQEDNANLDHSEHIDSWLHRAAKRSKHSERSEVNVVVTTMGVNHPRGLDFADHVTYARKKQQRKGKGRPSETVALTRHLAEFNEFNVNVSLPVLRCGVFSQGTMDFCFVRDMLVTQHWAMSTTSPNVNLEILCIDSCLGLKFLLYSGCMSQALAFICSILTMFGQQDDSVNGGSMESPLVSVRLEISSFDDPRKHHTVELHSFARLQSSKLVCLESELVHHCVLIKQLEVSDCTYDNVKTLECANMVFNKKFVPRILPAGVCDKALKTKNSQSAEMREEVPFSLSFSAAPTFLLTRHLQSLFQNSSDALSSPEDIENDSQPIAECIPSETTLVSVQDTIGKHEIGTLEKYFPLVSNVVEKVDSSKNLTGSRCSWKPAGSSSLSSPRGFSNRPKRSRAQVHYTLPGEGYDYSVKRRRMRKKSALPSKQLRRASFTRSSVGPRRTQKNFDLVACIANVLITNEEKGWREYGAVIVLEVADHNEWRLAIQLSGVTKYSYKATQMLQPGPKNRVSHAILWKGGEDWLLEFDEKSQWNLFKEMFEECYNRNIRAASVKSVPIPGVQLIEESDDQAEVPFVRHPRKYYRQLQTDTERAMDPCRVLYDIDSDDECWLMENEKCVDENMREGISAEFFEKTMDMFEKASFAQQRDKLTEDEVQELVNKTGSVEAAKVIYEHWQEKRGRKGMPLIRHLQPPLWELYQKQLKEWEHTVKTQERVPIPEKPPIFAFCQKPRGGLKQRSQRKFTASGRKSNHTPGDVSPPIQAPMRILSPGDESFSTSNDVSKSNRNRNKSTMKLDSHSRTKMTRDDLSSLRPCDLEGLQRLGTEQINGPAVIESWLKDAAAEADHEVKRAKHKKEEARKLNERADIKKIRAARYLIFAESMQAAVASD